MCTRSHMHACTGELQEPSKRMIARAVADQDQLVQDAKEGLETALPLGAR